MRKALLLSAILAVSLLSILPVSAQTTIIVPSGGDIQAAIDSISNGGTIILEAGTYFTNLVIDAPNKSFAIVAEDLVGLVTLDGSGIGSVISITNTGTHTITLEGLILTNGDATEGGGIHAKNATLTISYCVVMENNATHGGGMYCETADVTIQNSYIAGNTANYGAGILTDHCTAFAISDSNIRMNTATMYGGGIYNYHTDATCTVCIFEYNMAGNGGGMYNSHSDALITNCGFSLNGGTTYGGGIANTNDSDAVVTSCVFDSNMAAYGGGMENADSNPTVEGCTFSNNRANYGGGIRNYYNAHATITDCIFMSNTATKNGGGMINEDHSAPLITSCTFINNVANELGGGICNISGADPRVESCIFDENGAIVSGGGIYTRDADCTAINCILFDNISVQGGALFNYNSNSTVPRSITVTNCTFYGNKALDDPEQPTEIVGNAMFNVWIDTVVTNCILWDGGEGEIVSFSCTPVVTYCDVQGGYEGEGNINADPMFVNEGAKNFSLAFESPCINTGTDASAEAFGRVYEDITGLLRPQGGAYDMGAYELRRTYSPASMQPLVMTALGSVTQSWSIILGSLPGTLTAEEQAQLDSIQALMEQAKTLGNPIAANGALQQALAQMEALMVTL